MHDSSISLAFSLSIWVNFSASQKQDLTATPMDSVVQKSVKSIGEAHLTCNMALASGFSSAFPPKTTHPSGDLRAIRWFTSFVLPAWMCAWSMPMRRSTCPCPRRKVVFCKPRSSGKFNLWNLVAYVVNANCIDGIAFVAVDADQLNSILFCVHCFFFATHFSNGYWHVFALQPKGICSFLSN